MTILAGIVGLNDLPFIVIIAIGVGLSLAALAKSSLSRKSNSLIILGIFTAISIIATIVDVWVAHADPGTIFTRAMLFQWICVSTLNQLGGNSREHHTANQE